MSRLIDDLRADYRVNRRLLDRITVLAFRINQAAYRGRLRVVKRVLAKIVDALWLQLVIGADLPGRVACGPGLRLPHGGRGVVLHPNVRIGSAVTIYHRVTIGTYGHDTTNVPIIEDGAYIGAGAVIIGRLTVGEHAKVGANANTVQLDHYGFVGSTVRLRPVAVPGSFHVPAGVFAFHHAGVGSGSSFGEEPADEFADRVSPERVDGVRVLRGKKRPVGRWLGG